MKKPTVAVIKLSDAFADFWGDLANDIEFDIETLNGEDDAVPRAAHAVILAAGGAEARAIQWLEDRDGAIKVPIVAVGADPNRRIAVRSIQDGARDYFALPEDVELLRNALADFLRRPQTSEPASTDSDAVLPDAFNGIVGDSPAIKEVLWLAARLLPHQNATALILGETGTGKELLARALHDGGPRRNAPFVPVNCSALPDNLVESELFGHERGSFTDAHAAKPGLFEIADGGTLFLDEIGDLPLDLQAKLLRVLDDKHIRRVGGTKLREVDVRIIAATNEELERAVRDGKFRNDLYFRLSVVVLPLPPLRERDDDVELIAAALLRDAAAQHGLPVPPFTTEARSKLQGHHWPGNVRELKNAVERALLLSPPGELHLDQHLPTSVSTTEDGGVLPFPAPLAEIARAAARATLEHCDGNRSESARRLGISRRRLRGLLEDTDTATELMA